jgi:voltage-gated potassium channel
MSMNEKIVYALTTVIVLLLIGTFYFHKTESWSYTDSFYFSTMTLTTVGYGDLVPTNNSTKIFVSIYSIFGIGIMLFVLGSIIGREMVEQEQAFKRFFSRIYTLRRKNPEKEKLNNKRKTKKNKR